jgi:hypothetical protein
MENNSQRRFRVIYRPDAKGVKRMDTIVTGAGLPQQYMHFGPLIEKVVPEDGGELPEVKVPEKPMDPTMGPVQDKRILEAVQALDLKMANIERKLEELLEARKRPSRTRPKIDKKVPVLNGQQPTVS